jgi:BASS family bile acid:Na+ symporter
MDLASLVPIALKTSIVLTVFALGLEADTGGALGLLRRPAQLLRSLLAIDIVMPLAAVALVLAFDLDPAVKIALLALSLSPIPPVLPKKQFQAGGGVNYVFDLLVVAGVLAVAFVPFGLEIMQRVFSVSLQLPPARLANIVLVTILAPLLAGLLVNRIVHAIAARIARPISLLATAMLLASALLIAVKAWPAMLSLLGNGTLLAFAAFVVIGLVAGHLLGGPAAKDRTVLALATASRHPGIALAIASANFPEQKLVLPAVALYLAASTVLTIPYVKWRQRN